MAQRHPRRQPPREVEPEPVAPTPTDFPRQYPGPSCGHMVWSGGPPTVSEFPLRCPCSRMVELSLFEVG